MCVLILQVMEHFFRVIKTDDDKETVALACEAISHTLPSVGGFCMQKVFIEPLQSLYKSLNRAFIEPQQHINRVLIAR